MNIGSSVIEGDFSDIPAMTLLDEPRTAGLIRQTVKRLGRGTFIDLGAHVGEYSIPVAKAGLNVIAVEPFPKNYRRLEHNARFNGVLSSIVIMRTAVSNDIGEAYFFSSETQSGANSLRSSPNARRTLVRTSKLSDIIKEIGEADLIKVDIEGEEARVMSEASRYISSVRMWVVEVSDQTEPDVVRLMNQAGYSCKRIERLVRGTARNILCREAG